MVSFHQDLIATLFHPLSGQFRRRRNFGTEFHSFIGIWKEWDWVLKFQCGNFVFFIEFEKLERSRKASQRRKAGQLVYFICFIKFEEKKPVRFIEFDHHHYYRHHHSALLYVSLSLIITIIVVINRHFCSFHWVWKLESSSKADSKASSTQLNSLNWWPSYLLSMIS